MYHLGIEENRCQIKAEIESINFVLNRIRSKRVTPASAVENTGDFIFHIIIVYYWLPPPLQREETNPRPLKHHHHAGQQKWWFNVKFRNYCEAQGKGRAKGWPRKVTQRSFIDMDGGWWLSFPWCFTLNLVATHPPTFHRKSLNLHDSAQYGPGEVGRGKRRCVGSI